MGILFSMWVTSPVCVVCILKDFAFVYMFVIFAIKVSELNLCLYMPISRQFSICARASQVPFSLCSEIYFASLIRIISKEIVFLCSIQLVAIPTVTSYSLFSFGSVAVQQNTTFYYNAASSFKKWSVESAYGCQALSGYYGYLYGQGQGKSSITALVSVPFFPTKRNQSIHNSLIHSFIHSFIIHSFILQINILLIFNIASIFRLFV